MVLKGTHKHHLCQYKNTPSLPLSDKKHTPFHLFISSHWGVFFGEVQVVDEIMYGSSTAIACEQDTVSLRCIDRIANYEPNEIHAHINT